MRNVNKIIVHCSATLIEQDVDAAVIRSWHMSAPRNWSDIGYHFVIKRDGTIEAGRPLERVGAHCKGFNTGSIGICLIGGLNASGKPEDNFTETQKNSLRLLIDGFKFKYGLTEIKGHRDYSPDKNNDGVITKNEWLKVCPCFDVGEWYYGNNTRRIKEDKVRKPQVEEQKKNGVVSILVNDDNSSPDTKKSSKSKRKRSSSSKRTD